MAQENHTITEIHAGYHICGYMDDTVNPTTNHVGRVANAKSILSVESVVPSPWATALEAYERAHCIVAG